MTVPGEFVGPVRQTGEGALGLVVLFAGALAFNRLRRGVGSPGV
jgi:hypothetical protein